MDAGTQEGSEAPNRSLMLLDLCLLSRCSLFVDDAQRCRAPSQRGPLRADSTSDVSCVCEAFVDQLDL